MIKNKLSMKLGELRMTHAKLSSITGINENTLGDLYHGMATSIKLEHLDRICEALNCDITDIIAYEPNKIKVTGSRRRKGIHKK